MNRWGTKGAAVGLVMAHGRGGDGADILGLLDHAGLSGVSAIAPDAPGRSWWPTSFLAPQAQMEPFVLKGIAALTHAVQTLRTEGAQTIWLGGFSQGACLALETFARNGEGVAGVFAFSGGLVGTADAGGPADPTLYGHGQKRLDYPSRREGGRVWISVHQRDPHIPLARVEASATAFRAMGAKVSTHVAPGAGHGMFREDLDRLRAWLKP